MSRALPDIILVHVSRRMTKNCAPTLQGNWRCELCGMLVGEDDVHKKMPKEEAKKLAKEMQSKWGFGKKTGRTTA